MHRLLIMLVIVAILSGGSEVVIYESAVATDDWQFDVHKVHGQMEFVVGFEEQSWLSGTEQLPGMVKARLHDINFPQEVAFLAYLGECPSGGYAVEISRIVRQSDLLVVTVSARSPQPGDVVTMAFTYPFSLVTVPASTVEDVDHVIFVNPSGDTLGEVKLTAE